jgi:hypothetical protein
MSALYFPLIEMRAKLNALDHLRQNRTWFPVWQAGEDCKLDFENRRAPLWGPLRRSFTVAKLIRYKAGILITLLKSL